ncbi:MAG: 2OG-Fe(II) oxygenase [Proteobacteria bacterium]|uniref:2OG-Fe(II) oxygenase n=1 Tax=Aquabacterium sp. TaxID=1872578 RepID=UPI0035C6A7EB|nr:2OG-Fe(II) oxygenase [Pseudomonadota bacterium]
MGGQQITPELRDWIIAQAEAGHSPQSVLNAMQASGWEEDVALSAMEDVLQARAQAHTPDQQLTRKPMPDVPAMQASRIHAHDREVTLQVQIQHPRVVVIGGFLSAEECTQLMALAEPRLSRSETVVNATGGSEVNAARTSHGMFFGRGENALCARIEARIAALLQWPVEHGEGIQILRYAPGAEYRPHHDYFDPAQPGTPTILQRGGQRVGTLVMYLNDPLEGGATTFPDAGVTVHPVAGSAVFFAYPLPTPQTKTLHGGAPVLKGEKWVATKWLREGRFI